MLAYPSKEICEFVQFGRSRGFEIKVIVLKEEDFEKFISDYPCDVDVKISLSKLRGRGFQGEHKSVMSDGVVYVNAKYADHYDYWSDEQLLKDAIMYRNIKDLLRDIFKG